MFKVGDKVICINDKDSWNPVNNRIKKGDIYTIKEVDYDGDVALNETTPTHSYWWLASRFRKVKKKRFRNAITKELALEVLTTQPNTEVEKVKEKVK